MQVILGQDLSDLGIDTEVPIRYIAAIIVVGPQRVPVIVTVDTLGADLKIFDVLRSHTGQPIFLSALNASLWLRVIILSPFGVYSHHT